MLAKIGIISSRRVAIPTNGLVLYLDAGNTASYPGSGTTWTDLSGAGRHTTLQNATYSSNNGGVIQFSGGSTSKAEVSSLSFVNSTFTVIHAAKYLTTSGRTMTAVNNDWLSGHYSGKTENYYANGWVTAVNAGATDTNWRIFAATGDVVADNYKFYVNNVKTADNNGGVDGPNGLSIGGGRGEFANSQVGFVLAYNRVLTDTEIAAVFNFFKSRYGL
ncbi:MAG: hypothetical protein LCH91_05445 [Bacteroidetes bacterium]|nr:hypothetical protein [Bacteroidota bacterium]